MLIAKQKKELLPYMNEKTIKTPIHRLRTVGIAEGISFLILLCIAMPLKYLAGMPIAVKIAGWTHGLLFISFITILLNVKNTYNWPVSKTLGAVLAALLPFGTFVLDARLRKEDQQPNPDMTANEAV